MSRKASYTKGTMHHAERKSNISLFVSMSRVPTEYIIVLTHEHWPSPDRDQRPLTEWPGTSLVYTDQYPVPVLPLIATVTRQCWVLTPTIRQSDNIYIKIQILLKMFSILVTFFMVLPGLRSHLHPHARTKRSDEKAEDVKAHISDELDEAYTQEAVENMTEEERDYHYFRLHDFDKNDLLDGLEVFKALVHEHEHNKNDSESEPEKYGDKSFDDIVEVIDQVKPKPNI